MKPQKQASVQMMQFITAMWISEPIYAAARLGIADILADGAQSIMVLAGQTDSFEPYLYRLMHSLASVGIFRETAAGVFENTPLSECLKAEEMRSTVLFFLSGWHKQAWDKLFYSIKTGKTAFQAAHGQLPFDWFKRNPGEAMLFNEANAIKIKNSQPFLIHAYDFSNIVSITDIGGGTGGLITEILKKNPHMTGIVADLDYLADEAENFIRNQGLEDRCRFIPCDFFKEIPGSSDLYILCNILHDWEDEKSNLILNNCRKAMKAEAKLLIIEMIVPPGNEPSVSKLLDIEVLVMGGGKERTESEFRSLLEKAGFQINRIITTSDNNRLIECLISVHG